jgi:GDP/UDP-N,N'-diacetylbacillosamine 2-epimerase (hydrolysing)
MRIAVLTSSRADYGIYLPLLEGLRTDPFFELELVVFGTHLSRFHGYTLDEIRANGFKPYVTIDSMALGDSPEAISGAMGLTMARFAGYWAEAKERIQLAICLGDRFEMFAAVCASVPFNITLAHIHGGETTSGAIDDTFRDSLTHMARHHFTSTEEHAERVAQLIGSKDGVYNVGALSLDNLEKIELFSGGEFENCFGVGVDANTILVTLHPETRAVDEVEQHARTVAESLAGELDLKALITMPNADTAGTEIRNVFNELAGKHPERIALVENLGTRGYFTAMSRCAFLLGNSSSGIIEAASFGKRVINLGNRQKGRVVGPNVMHVPFDREKLQMAMTRITELPSPGKENIYFLGCASRRIVEVLKENHSFD